MIFNYFKYFESTVTGSEEYNCFTLLWSILLQ